MEMHFRESFKLDVQHMIVLKKILEAKEGGTTFENLGSSIFKEFKKLDPQGARPITRTRLYGIIDFLADRGLILKIGKPLVLEISEKKKKCAISFVQGFMDNIDEYEGAKINAS